MFIGDEWKWTVAILFWIAVFLSPFIIIAIFIYKKFFKEKHDKKTSRKLKKLPSTRVAKFQGFYYKHRIITILLIIGVSWAIIWLGQVAVERYSFYKVEKTMDKINQEINSKFSVLSVQKDRSCGTSSEAFGEHLGGCSIEYVYSIEPGNHVKETAEKIDALIQNRDDVAIDNPEPSLFKDTTFIKINNYSDSKSDRYSSSYNFNGITNPTCEVMYALHSVNSRNNLSVSISCFLSGSNAKFPYFPVQK